MANQPVVKGRATRRGLRSLDGKFYHTKKERSAADKAFNFATLKAAKIPNQQVGENKDPFDFTFTETPAKDHPEVKIIKPQYHCNNCQTAVSYGTLVCPVCGGRLNWEGL